MKCAAALGLAACSGGGQSNDGGADAAAETGADSGADASTNPLPFTPSNVSLAGLDLGHVQDETVSGPCVIRSGGGQTCFSKPVETDVKQSDGSMVHLLVVKSLRVESTGKISLSVTGGGSKPVAIVSLGDFTLNGTIDGGATGDTPGPGGGTAGSEQKGGGQGGGAASNGTTEVSAGGGSYCGVGGQGVAQQGASGTPGAKAAAYGAPTIIPLVAGSAGGGGAIGGGAGGAGVQLVAGGAFTLGAGAYVTVGGGGGGQAGLANGQEAGGGGSGGAILIEATTAMLSGTLAANGAGGGGSSGDGQNGGPDATIPVGGMGTLHGGAGSAGTTIDGMTPTAPASAGSAPSGGGGVGRIRINTKSGMATIAMSAVLSPATSTPCATQGTVAP